MACGQACPSPSLSSPRAFADACADIFGQRMRRDPVPDGGRRYARPLAPDVPTGLRPDSVCNGCADPWLRHRQYRDETLYDTNSEAFRFSGNLGGRRIALGYLDCPLRFLVG